MIPRPNLSAEALSGVVEKALEEYFLYSVPEEKFVRYEVDAYDALEVQNFLFEAGVYEVLEKHIVKELKKSSGKPKPIKCRLCRLLGRV
jgi:hypothetical protein